MGKLSREGRIWRGRAGKSGRCCRLRLGDERLNRCKGFGRRVWSSLLAFDLGLVWIRLNGLNRARRRNLRLKMAEEKNEEKVLFEDETGVGLRSCVRERERGREAAVEDFLGERERRRVRSRRKRMI